MDKPFRTSRSTNLKSTERIDRDNSLFAICRTPPKIQIEPKDSFASGLAVRAPLRAFSFQNAGQMATGRGRRGMASLPEQRIAFLLKNSYPFSAKREEPDPPEHTLAILDSEQWNS